MDPLRHSRPSQRHWSAVFLYCLILSSSENLTANQSNTFREKKNLHVSLRRVSLICNPIQVMARYRSQVCYSEGAKFCRPIKHWLMNSLHAGVNKKKLTEIFDNGIHLHQIMLEINWMRRYWQYKRNPVSHFNLNDRLYMQPGSSVLKLMKYQQVCLSSSIDYEVSS